MCVRVPKEPASLLFSATLRRILAAVRIPRLILRSCVEKWPFFGVGKWPNLGVGKWPFLGVGKRPASLAGPCNRKGSKNDRIRQAIFPNRYVQAGDAAQARHLLVRAKPLPTPSSLVFSMSWLPPAGVQPSLNCTQGWAEGGRSENGVARSPV